MSNKDKPVKHAKSSDLTNFPVNTLGIFVLIFGSVFSLEKWIILSLKDGKLENFHSSNFVLFFWHVSASERASLHNFFRS
jgi:hypothetical protein